VGQGQIELPPNARVLALPQRPYFPLGTLRQALTYPTPAEEVLDADVRTALAAAGLGHLADRLDEEAEWNTLLSGGEQQRIGFARALIHQPDLLLLDEAVSTLEDTEARELYALLSERLPRTMVISIGRATALVALHQRIVDMTGTSAASRSQRSAALAPVPA
jgi:putative ATP-binding cassette transporter